MELLPVVTIELLPASQRARCAPPVDHHPYSLPALERGLRIGWEKRREKIEVLICGSHVGPMLTLSSHRIKLGLIPRKD
jgi:hypothetical protein